MHPATSVRKVRAPLLPSSSLFFSSASSLECLAPATYLLTPTLAPPMEFVIPPARHDSLDSDVAGGEQRGLMSDYAPGASAMTVVMMMMNL